jgi:hypothetical protein
VNEQTHALSPFDPNTIVHTPHCCFVLHIAPIGGARSKCLYLNLSSVSESPLHFGTMICGPINLTTKIMPPHKLGRATRRVSRLKPRSFTLVYKLTPKLFFVLFTLPTVHPALPNVMVPNYDSVFQQDLASVLNTTR